MKTEINFKWALFFFQATWVFIHIISFSSLSQLLWNRCYYHKSTNKKNKLGDVKHLLLHLLVNGRAKGSHSSLENPILLCSKVSMSHGFWTLTGSSRQHRPVLGCLPRLSFFSLAFLPRSSELLLCTSQLVNFVLLNCIHSRTFSFWYILVNILRLLSI